MRVDNFQFQIYKDDNLSGLINPKKQLNGLSVFMLLSKCLQKADKSGDGILSEQELNIFRLKKSSDILKEIQGEISSYTLDVDEEDLMDLMDKVKVLITKNNEINEDVENLKGMSKEDFIKMAEQKAVEAGINIENYGNEIEADELSLQDEEDFEEDEYASFDLDEEVDISEDEIEDEDETEETSNSDVLWQLIYQDGAEDIFDKMDTDDNGILSEDEILALSGADGDDTNLSMTDLSNLFAFGYHEDIEETEKVESESATEEETQPTAEYTPTETPSDYKPSPASDSSGSSGPAPSNYDSSSTDKLENKARTVNDIDAEIQEQEQSKTSIKEKATQDINAQQTQIDTLLAQSDLSEEFKAEYNSENTRLQGLIDEKDTAIETKKTAIQEANATIASFTTAIGSIDSQIADMNAQKSKLDETLDSEKIKEYDEKIANLNSEKEKLQDSINEQNKLIEDTNNEIGTLEEEKTNLTAEKDNILETLSNKYQNEKEKIENFKTQIENCKNEIKNIETKLQSDLAEVDKNIQTLKDEKANLIQAEKTQKILTDNSMIPDSTPYQMTSNPENFDWTSIGYNAEAGKQIADGVYSYANGRTGNHNCLGGVKKGFNNAFGTNPFKDIHAGYLAAGVLEKDPNYREITGLDIEQLKYLPAGTVISWSNSTSGTSPASKYGHCSVSLGNGYEASDHVCKQYRHVGSNGTPRVFIPISDPSAYRA